MFNKNSNKSKLVLICILFAAILFSGITYATQGDSLAKIFGKKQAEALANAGDGIVAMFNGEKITKKGFDTYKLIMNSGSIKLSDKEILDKIVERQIEYKQAIKEGITATDEEVNNFIKSAQDTVKITDNDYAAFKDYISGMNMTEEQYWESVKPAYKKAIICGKFKKSLKEKFAEEKNIKDELQLNKEFNVFYNQYLKDLKSKVKIETNLK